MPVDISHMDSRALTRHIANDMVARKVVPTGESVRKAIIAITDGVSNPSASTIQDEFKKWMEDTFWPTYGVLQGLPDNRDVSARLAQLYSDGFQQIVIGAIDIAKASYTGERAQFEADAARSAETIVNLEELLATAKADGEKWKSLHEQEAAIHAADEVVHANALKALRSEHTAVVERMASDNAALIETASRQTRLAEDLSAAREADRVQAATQLANAQEDTKRGLREIDQLRQEEKAAAKRVLELNSQIATMNQSLEAAEHRYRDLVASSAAERQSMTATLLAQKNTPAPAPSGPRKMSLAVKHRTFKKRVV